MTEGHPPAQIVDRLLAGDDYRIADIGRWWLQRACAFRARPMLPPPGEPPRDALGRPRFASGHWIKPRFTASRAFRRALAAHGCEQASGSWYVTLPSKLRRGEIVTVDGLGAFDLIQRKPGSRVRFAYAESVLLAVGAETERLLVRLP